MSLDPALVALLRDLRADLALAVQCVEIGAVPGPAAVKRMREHVALIDEITSKKEKTDG